MPREKPWELCRRLAADTFQRIREDRRGASVPVARLLEVIEEKLLEPELQVDDLRRESGQLDPNLSTRFATELGLPPSTYVLQDRMTIAGRMLTAANHKIREIAVEVGYLSPNSFGRAFKKWCGQSPTDFRKASRAGGAPSPRPQAELVDREELRREVGRHLPAEDATALLDRLGGLQDTVQGHYHDPVPAVRREHWVEPAMAERLWRWIEILPPEEQMAAVNSQGNAFETPALFHRLCTESIEIGLKDDVRGMHVAALALVAMNKIILRLGRQPMTLNLFARAHAVSGHALQRSGYLDDAGDAFGIATRMLTLAGDDAHPVVTMELCLYQAMLHLERDELDDAVMLTDIGVQLYEALLVKLKQQAEAEEAEAGSGEPASSKASDSASDG